MLYNILLIYNVPICRLTWQYSVTNKHFAFYDIYIYNIIAVLSYPMYFFYSFSITDSWQTSLYKLFNSIFLMYNLMYVKYYL